MVIASRESARVFYHSCGQEAKQVDTRRQIIFQIRRRRCKSDARREFGGYAARGSPVSQSRTVALRLRKHRRTLVFATWNHDRHKACSFEMIRSCNR